MRRGYPVTVNGVGFFGFARAVTTDLVGAGIISTRQRRSVGRRLSYVLLRIPGFMMFLGVMPGERDPASPRPCHSKHMILNEACSAVGIAMRASVAHPFLARETSL